LGVRVIARNWNTIGLGGSLKGTVGLEEGAGYRIDKVMTRLKAIEQSKR
jgi:hypothetical protein